LDTKPTRSRGLIAAYLTMVGVNSFATTFYFYYLYWFTERVHHFTKVQNFALAATLGAAYGAASFVGGRFAQRRGYFTSLKVGWGLMVLFIGAGAFVTPLPALLALMFLANAAQAFTWPALEALVSEGDDAEHLPRNIGIYNLMWAGVGAVAYFLGGTMINAWSYRAMFVVPAVISLAHFVVIFFVERWAKRLPHHAAVHHLDDDLEERRACRVPPATFLKMAWLGNPLAYLAINTIVSVIPALATQLQLSVAWGGMFCSLWQFMRAGSFLLLWQWKGWHYRFRWLMAAYIAMSLSFIAILVVPNLVVLVVAQVFFGLGAGLLYYSSLYYSMHVGEARGEHGGAHEAAIGIGCAVGPAITAASLHFFGAQSPAGAIAVGVVLLVGGGVLLKWRYR
jgi:MFS family permease